MIQHALHEEKGEIAAILAASTRAGLVTSAIEALAAAQAPSFASEQTVERTFSVEAPDFDTLLSRVLAAAIESGIANTEAYDGVKFTLITAMKAEGALLGQRVASRGRDIRSARIDGTIAKNEETGHWTGRVSFKE